MLGILAVFSIIFAIVFATSKASLLDQLKQYASQSQYSTEMFQAAFSVNNVMDESLDLALKSCQHSFKWRRWNCPNQDFIRRHMNQALWLDREDAYIIAIVTAATLYSITKSCSSGFVAGCGCNNNLIGESCSDDPRRAVEIFEQNDYSVFHTDLAGSVRKHNHLAVTTLLRHSLIPQCSCAIMGTTHCTKKVCVMLLKPFKEIAHELRNMYDDAIQISHTEPNMRILWKNVPLNALVFMKDEPNYCEPEAAPLWNGLRGRQCSTLGHSKANIEERESCRTLCLACGLNVRTRNIVTEHRCNCKLNWTYQLQCDTCVNIERQYYCY